MGAAGGAEGVAGGTAAMFEGEVGAAADSSGVGGISCANPTPAVTMQPIKATNPRQGFPITQVSIVSSGGVS
jgi:hypothetical protein